MLWMAFIAQQQLDYLYGPRSPNLLETSAVLNACSVNWIRLHVHYVAILAYKFLFCHSCFFYSLTDTWFIYKSEQIYLFPSRSLVRNMIKYQMLIGMPFT